MRAPPRILFFRWVTLTEHYWVTFRERRSRTVLFHQPPIRPSFRIFNNIIPLCRCGIPRSGKRYQSLCPVTQTSLSQQKQAKFTTPKNPVTKIFRVGDKW
jgi:hypothetical protein